MAIARGTATTSHNSGDSGSPTRPSCASVMSVAPKYEGKNIATATQKPNVTSETSSGRSLFRL
ncbi:hypothetical protein [Rhodococcus sp. 06-418-5]|jgi:hypothetical protein|uniref:hypothetical protein n=1 Tax=Rhodococcus sp. 06-418-5 TaxID=2022507 RepID=UPI001179E6A3|nr:hypothetical protein [Rhodococcus sp. 06-418-5]